MIGRTNRFHGHNSLKKLYATSKSVRSTMLALRYAPNSHRQTYRLAVVVSRKVSKSAVVRNRIRRRLYENVRILSKDFQTPCDLVLLVYDERIANVESAKLTAEVAKLCRKAGLTASEPLEHAIVEH